MMPRLPLPLHGPYGPYGPYGPFRFIRTYYLQRRTPKPVPTIDPAPSFMHAPKPHTPGQRHVRKAVHPHVFPGKPVYALTVRRLRTGGRNNTGKISTNHIGGGLNRRLRIVDFMRASQGEQHVVRIEFDPGRSAHIALLRHPVDSTLSYILAPKDLRAGDRVTSYRDITPRQIKDIIARSEYSSGAIAPPSEKAQEKPAIAGPAEEGLTASSSASLDLGILRLLTVKPGSFLPLHLIPLSTPIHGLTLTPTGPQRLVRSAGSFATLVGFVKDRAHVRLQSGEVRSLDKNCFAAVGQVSNEQHQMVRLGKAGAARNWSRRPTVRGVAMNAVDHPHGGGRGKGKGGNVPRSRTGVLAKGGKTRRPTDKGGNKAVIRPRPNGPHVGGSKW